MSFDSYLLSFESSFPAGSLLSLGVAFVAGVLSSSVCPCTIPMGMGVAGMIGTSETKKRGILIAVLFFLGLLSSFLVLSYMSSKLGLMLSQTFGIGWSFAMALVSLVAAIYAFFGPRLKVKTYKKLQNPGLLGTFIYGFIFSIGTSVAPLLLLLSVSTVKGDTNEGILLSLFFGLGKGLPFLIIPYFAGALLKLVRLENGSNIVRYVSSLGLLFVSGYYFRTFIQFT